MIRNIVFDLGGVVIPLTPERAWNRFEQLGVKDVRERMGLYGQTGIFLELENGTIGTDEFLGKLSELILSQAGDTGQDILPPGGVTYEQALWAWRGYVEDIDLHRLNNLLILKKNYNVILLSNTNPFIVGWAESDAFSGDGHSLSYYFHRTFYSCVMKDYKPSATIFLSMLRESGISAEETLFLDDSSKNIEAAERLGIHGLLVEKNIDWMDKLTERLKM